MNNEVDYTDFEGLMKMVQPEMFKPENIYALLKLAFMTGKLSGLREGMNVGKKMEDDWLRS
jgi:hypothetical protein